jgi:beta-phosphoglucomutase
LLPGLSYGICYAMIEGAIFDMDGVLVDNAAYHIRAWQELGAELGIRLADESVRRVFGQRNGEMIAALIGGPLTPEQVEQYAGRKEEIYRRLITPDLRPTPGLIEFLAELRTELFRTAVATSGPLENANLVLDGLGIRSWFDVVVTGGEVTRGKPDPEIFLLAAQRLNLHPSQCVVFEDSTAGIEAAQRAGSVCVVLSTTHSQEELRGYTSSHIIPDFRSLQAADLRHF